MYALRPEEQLQASLAEVTRLLEKHRVLEAWVHRQEGARQDIVESLQHRQNLAELHNKLRTLHPADVAYIAEALPPDERLLIWQEVDVNRRGAVLVEVSTPVRDALIEQSSRDELLASLRELDADDLSFLADSLPPDVLQSLLEALGASERSWLQSSIAYPEHTVGHLMIADVVVVPDSLTVQGVITALRQRGRLPEHTDRVFIIDSRHVLRGMVPLSQLLLLPADAPVLTALSPSPLVFDPNEDAEEAAKAFERYDLVTAPVVDNRGKLLGRLTIDAVVDFIREQSERRALTRAGLRGDEDLFASAWDSARNRWPWLLLNMFTAVVASRVIGLFEDTIEELVALAALMPIVASIGGNTGNQTVALVIRGLATNQLGWATAHRLVRKELVVSLMNGLVWGGVMGAFALVVYRSLPLGLVMMAAVLLNLIIAALVGLAVPLVLDRLGRDPAEGASVLLTFMTDSMGFFLFLGLATLFLL